MNEAINIICNIITGKDHDGIADKFTNKKCRKKM